MKYQSSEVYLALVNSQVKTLSEGFTLRGYVLTERLKAHILTCAIASAQVEYEVRIVEDLRKRGLPQSELISCFIKETGSNSDWARTICTSEF